MEATSLPSSSTKSGRWSIGTKEALVLIFATAAGNEASQLLIREGSGTANETGVAKDGRWFSGMVKDSGREGMFSWAASFCGFHWHLARGHQSILDRSQDPDLVSLSVTKQILKC